MEYAKLKFEEFSSWNLKINCEKCDSVELKEFLQTKRILGKDWIKNKGPFISIFLTKPHIKEQITLMEEKDERE